MNRKNNRDTRIEDLLKFGTLSREHRENLRLTISHTGQSMVSDMTMPWKVREDDPKKHEIIQTNSTMVRG